MVEMVPELQYITWKDGEKKMGERKTPEKKTLGNNPPNTDNLVH